jgi:predicted RNA-binding protein with TRAM domain
VSTALAIAATTAVLKRILENGITSANLTGILNNITVSALPPDRIPAGENEVSQLNLFLYQVTPNQGWRNAELPSRDQRGDRLSGPPLAVDLHYLLSAYGAQDLHAEILLGHGMQLFHELPVLSREEIRRVFTPPPPPSPILQRLATAELADQEELVKLTPETLSTEEISKLWSVFGEKYRPTAAFLATVVLIRARPATRAAPPVREPRVQVVTLRNPVIAAVEPQTADPLAQVPLTVSGNALLVPGTVVRFGTGAEVPPASGSTPQRLLVPLPAGLPAGVNTVQVVQPVALGTPPVPHGGFESNTAAFVLRPALRRRTVATGQEPDVTVDQVTDTGGGTRSARVTVRLLPDVARRQRVRLLLNEPGAPAGRPPRAYGFDAPSRETDPAETTDTIRVPVNRVVAGDYLLRVRVDGADTALEADAEGRWRRPGVSIR